MNPERCAATLEGDLIWVETEYRHKDAIKRVPGATWDQDRLMWKVSCTWPTILALTAELPIEGDPALKAWVEREYQLEAALAELRSATGLGTYQGWEKLRPLQKVGVDYLRVAKDVILADEMGGGKTVEACVAMRDLETILVVAPKQVLKNWANHIREWAPGITPFVAVDTAAKRRKAIDAFKEHDGPKALIMNYESAWRHARLTGYGPIALQKCEQHGGMAKETVCEVHTRELNDIHWDLLIADEAHRLKDPSAKQTRGLWWLSGRSDRVWALTGTPVGNKSDDLWSLLHLVDPVAWPARGRYIDRYCQLTFDAYTGHLKVTGIRPEAQGEFQSAIARYFLRRTQAQLIGKDIKKVYELRHIDLTPAQRKQYRSFKNEILTDVTGGQVLTGDELSSLIRCRQVANSLLDLNEDGEVKMVDAKLKNNAVWDLWNSDMAREPLVVMAGGPGSRQHIDLLGEFLNKKGVAYSKIVGGMSVEDLHYQAHRFQNGETKLFIGMSQVAGEGIDLYTANVIAFVQRSWSFIENSQAEDRIRRFGQEADAITVIDFVAEDTCEERVMEIYHEKGEIAEEVNRDRLKELL